MSNCSYLVNGQPCEAAGTPYYNFAVCDEHKASLEWLKRATALQAASQHPLEAFPGVCYIALLPDGTVKIGYSNSDDLYHKRKQSLSREYGAPVVELLKMPGGFVAEAMLHDRFKELRIPGPGERFNYSPDIAEFIAERR